jgi:branched-subunit amino acid transport protein
MTLWLVFLAGGLLTFGTRLSFILLFSRFNIPIWLTRALRFVPIAILSAIIAPELFLQSGNLALSFENQRLLAGLLAIFIAWRTRNALLTIASGMLALWLLQWIF